MIFSSQYFKFIAKVSRYFSDIGNRTTGPGGGFWFHWHASQLLVIFVIADFKTLFELEGCPTLLIRFSN